MMCCHHSNRVTFALEGHGGVDNQALGTTDTQVRVEEHHSLCRHGSSIFLVDIYRLTSSRSKGLLCTNVRTSAVTHHLQVKYAEVVRIIDRQLAIC